MGTVPQPNDSDPPISFSSFLGFLRDFSKSATLGIPVHLPTYSVDDMAVTLRMNRRDIDTNIIEMFTCPVCMDVILPPIKMCVRGHSICGVCKEKLKTQVCPTCRSEFSTTPNRLADAFLSNCTHQCKFRGDGCLLELTGMEMADHLKICDYRPLECRICRKSVMYRDFVEHMRDKEKVDIFVTSRHRAGYCLGQAEKRADYSDTWIPLWLHFEEHDFFCFLEHSDETWWLWVGVFRPPSAGDHRQEFFASVTIWNKDNCEEMTFMGKVHPLRASPLEVLRSEQCLILDEDTLGKFVREDGIDVRICLSTKFTQGE